MTNYAKTIISTAREQFSSEMLKLAGECADSTSESKPISVEISDIMPFFEACLTTAYNIVKAEVGDDIVKGSWEDFKRKCEALPVSMEAADVASFLGICQNTAYKMLKENHIPNITLPGVKRVIVPKPLFLEWYLNGGHIAA